MAATNRVLIEAGRAYAVKIMRRGGVLEFIVDGKLVLSWTDEQPLASGPVTLQTWDSRISVDDFRVRRFPSTPRIEMVDAATGRPLNAEAVAQLRASRDCPTWQVTRAEDSSRLEPTFLVRTRGTAYRATFCGFPSEGLDEYDDHNWFCFQFAGQPALRVHLRDIGSERTADYDEAAGLTVLPVEQGGSLFIDVAGMAAARTAARLKLYYGLAGGQPKPIAAQEVTLGTSSGPLLSHTLQLEADGPGSYQVLARITKGSTVLATATAPFRLMSTDELFDAGAGFRLRRAGFRVDVDKRSGVIKGLFEDGGASATNYVGNETNLNPFGQFDTRFFGDVMVTSRLSGLPWRRETTALSCDVRRVSAYKGGVLVSYGEGSKAPQGGFQNVRLWELYQVNPSTQTLDWDIYIENAQTFPIELGEVALPLLVNDTFFGLGGNRELAHTQRVFAYAYAGGHSGFVLVQRLSGDPPFLLIVPADGTAFEEVAPDENGFYGPRGAEWFGLRTVYLHSSAVAERAQWKPGVNPNTAAVLEAGERRRFGVRMAWINSTDEIPATLFRLGKIGIQVVPGMVVPTNQTAALLCWSGKPILKAQPLDPGIQIGRSTTKGNATLYAIGFEGEGQKRLRLYTGPNEWTTLAFYAVAPLEKLIDARATFIVNRQQYRNPDDTLGRDYGFIPYSKAESNIAQEVPIPSPLIGCSDLGGFADPLFLARKNVYRPSERQVQVLEDYVVNCLLKHVQDPATYTIRSSLYVNQERAWSEPDALDTTRTYNYAFALNIYYDLYRIGSLYGLTRAKEPKAYLELAANTAIAMFDQTRWRYDGQVGGGTVLDVLDALQREEMLDKHAELRSRVEACNEAFSKAPFPYGGPIVYDPTTYVQVLRFCRHFDAKEKADQTLRIMLAMRGKQPVWTQYGTDRQWWHFEQYGAQRSLEEVGLFYSSAVNGAALLDGYRNTGERPMLLLGYAGVLNPWAAVNKVGEASTGYHTDPRTRDFDPLSTANAIGLWGSLEGLGAYLVRDPNFGVIGLGCDVSASPAYTIVPKDGLFKRAFVQPVAVGVELDVGRLTRIAVSPDGAKVRVAFEVDQYFEKRSTVTITGLRHGRYRVTANGKTDEVRVEAAELVLPRSRPRGKRTSSPSNPSRSPSPPTRTRTERRYARAASGGSRRIAARSRSRIVRWRLLSPTLRPRPSRT